MELLKTVQNIKGIYYHTYQQVFMKSFFGFILLFLLSKFHFPSLFYVT